MISIFVMIIYPDNRERQGTAMYLCQPYFGLETVSVFEREALNDQCLGVGD